MAPVTVLIAAVFLIAPWSPAAAQTPSIRVIRTVAGTGTYGFSGDGGPATAAQITTAPAAVLDSAGNLYISDLYNNRIRRVDHATGIVTTVAGTGVYGSRGDGGPATAAEMGSVMSMAFDAADNLYIGDGVTYTIRRIDAVTGFVTRVAGSGTYGYSGDGGPATQAEIAAPWGIAVDDAGNLYIAAGENYRVRKVNLATGIMTTAAGDGSWMWGGDGGLATAAQIGYPYAVAVDAAGNLFIGDGQNFVVRRVDAASGLITTVAGSGVFGDSGDGGPATAAQISAPTGLAVDGLGNLYIVDNSNNRVRMVDGATGTITTVAGGGGSTGDGIPAADAALQNVFSITSNAAGHLVFGDQYRVRHVSSAVAPAFTAEGANAAVLTNDPASFTVAITGLPGPSVIWQVSTDLGQTFTNLTDAPPYSGSSTPVLAIASATFSLNGYLYRAHLTNPWGEAWSTPLSLTVTKRTPVVTWASPAPVLPGTTLDASQLNATADVPGSFVYDPPAGTVLAAGSDQLLTATFTPTDGASYVAVVKYALISAIGANNEGARIITTIAGTGTQGFSGDGGPATAARLYSPYGIAADAAGNLYIPDVGNHRLRKVDAVTGTITTVAGTGTAGFNGDGLAATATQFNGIVAIAFDAAGNTYVADYNNHRVRRIDAATQTVTTVAGTGVWGFDGDDGPATAATLREPLALAFNAAGDLYIADTNGTRIRKVSAATGVITSVLTTGQAGALAFDAAGNLYFSDHDNSRVKMWSASSGLVTTIAGNGNWAYSGDGGPAIAAELNGPMGISLDGSGNVYIADAYNRRIRMIAVSTGIITTVAGTGTSGAAGDGGLAAAAEFINPNRVVAMGRALYVSDLSNRVRKIAEGAAPLILQQPANRGTDVGGTVGFTAGVSGFPPPALKWQVSSNGTTWADVTNAAPYSGATTAALTITGATLDLNGLQYHVVASNAIGTATSNAATLTVATVVKETPVITWPTPAAITYGTLLSATQLNAAANVSGSFAYTPAAGTKLSGGSHTLSVLFTPDDGANYTTATAQVTQQVYRAPSIITWPDPVGVVYGTALSAAQLNATANVPGSFLYGPAAGTVLNAGTHFLSVFFTPTAAGDYAPSSASASIVVSQATPVITWTTPAPIVFGTPLGAAQLSATSSTAGTFVYSQPPGTVLPSGAHVVTATFTPTDALNFTSASASVSVVVQQATPTITWPSPAPILHGMLLGDTQLNAAANVPGSFVYYPAAGTELGIGAAQDLRAYFTPSDTLNFASVIKVTTIDVNPSGPIITTIAGVTPGNAFSGDGGAALAAEFHSPGELAVDLAGNVFVSDLYNYRVRRIAAGTGLISTVAGSGDVAPADGGYAGDGGPATAARFWWIQGLAVDGAGNLFLADSANDRVRKVTAATGIVSTVAGTGVDGYSGDGGPATLARLGYASGAALDGAGNLYFADSNNSRIRKVSAATGVITTVAGDGSVGFSGDGGPATLARIYQAGNVTTDLAGNLYIVDYVNQRIRKVTAATGIITTIAGNGVGDFTGDGGPATQASLDHPNSVAVDGAGNVYIMDAGNYRVRKIDAATGIITTVAGTGVYNSGAVGDGEEATRAGLGVVSAIALDAAGNLYLAGSDSNRIRKITALGAPSYWLTMTPAPVHGKVSGGGIDCGTGGTTCQAGFASATTVTLTATPDTDYLFQAWGGACSGTDPSVTVNVGASTACSATFVPAAPPDGPPYTFTVTTPTGGRVQGAGINCGAGGTACSITMPASMTLGISATASSGYTFTGWTGDCTGATASIWVALNGPRTCGATFTPVGGGGGGLPSGPPYTLTISPPIGGKVQGAGINCGAGGTACSVTMPASMTLGMGAVASAGYTFAGWTGDCTGTIADLWVSLGGPRTCGATFTPAGGGGSSYALTVSPAPTGGAVTGNGLNCGAGGVACTVSLAGGTVASLTAAPSSGYVFTSWGGACSGTAATTTVLVDAARTCSATFTASGGGPVNGPPYTLTVTPPTGGTVTGAGINCGAGGTACSVTMPASMTLGISATASTGYTFTAWTGDCAGTSPSKWVALNGPRTCGATFTATGGGGGGGGLPSGPPYTLTITMPTGGKVEGAGINCGAGGTACSVTMPASMTLGVSATPSTGYTFTGWTGDCAGTNPSLWVSLGGARTCGATFMPSGGAGH